MITMKNITYTWIAFVHFLLAIIFLRPKWVNLSYHQSGTCTESELTDYYHRSLQIDKSIDAQVQPSAVLLTGDSFTQSLLSSTIIPNSVNYGIAMDTTFGVLNRLSHYHSLNTASSIFIEIGINDFWRVEATKILLKTLRL
jgi:hypothetical protein